jgi:hypothetical protein
MCETKPMTRAGLANYYNVNVRTFKKWIRPFEKEIGKPEGNIYTPRQVEIIFQKLGK